MKNGIFRNLLDRFTRAPGSLVEAMAGSLKGILSGLVSPRLARLMGAVSATTALIFATMATSIVAVDARAQEQMQIKPNTHVPLPTLQDRVVKANTTVTNFTAEEIRNAVVPHDAVPGDNDDDDGTQGRAGTEWTVTECAIRVSGRGVRVYDGNADNNVLISACTADVGDPLDGKAGSKGFAPMFFHATEADDLTTEDENEAKSKDGASVSVRITVTVKFYEEERVGNDPFDFDETRTIESALSFRVTVRNDSPELKSGLLSSVFARFDENKSPVVSANVTPSIQSYLGGAFETQDSKTLRYTMSGGDSAYQEVDVHPPDEEEIDDDEEYPTIPKKIFQIDRDTGAITLATAASYGQDDEPRLVDTDDGAVDITEDFNFEEQRSFTLTISTRDNYGGVSDPATLRLALRDVNERPVYLGGDDIEEEDQRFLENIGITGVTEFDDDDPGTVIITAEELSDKFEDPDADTRLRFKITDDSGDPAPTGECVWADSDNGTAVGAELIFVNNDLYIVPEHDLEVDSTQCTVYIVATDNNDTPLSSDVASFELSVKRTLNDGPRFISSVRAYEIEENTVTVDEDRDPKFVVSDTDDEDTVCFHLEGPNGYEFDVYPSDNACRVGGYQELVNGRLSIQLKPKASDREKDINFDYDKLGSDKTKIVHIVAEDNYGERSDPEIIRIEITNVNEPPELVTKPVPAQELLDNQMRTMLTGSDDAVEDSTPPRLTIDFSGIFEDPDGDVLFYSAELLNRRNYMEVAVRGRTAVITLKPATRGAEASDYVGTYTIKLEAADREEDEDEDDRIDDEDKALKKEITFEVHVKESNLPPQFDPSANFSAVSLSEHPNPANYDTDDEGAIILPIHHEATQEVDGVTENDELMYSIVGSHADSFAVNNDEPEDEDDSEVGQVLLRADHQLNYEEDALFKVTVQVSDGFPGGTDTYTFDVILADANDPLSRSPARAPIEVGVGGDPVTIDLLDAGEGLFFDEDEEPAYIDELEFDAVADTETVEVSISGSLLTITAVPEEPADPEEPEDPAAPGYEEVTVTVGAYVVINGRRSAVPAQTNQQLVHRLDEPPTPPNVPPVVVGGGIADQVVKSDGSASEAMDLAPHFSDSDVDDTLTYSAAVAGSAVDATVSGTMLTIGKSASGSDGDTDTVTVTADDGNGGTVTLTFGVSVNHAPKVDAIADQRIASNASGANNVKINIEDMVADGDFDAQTISALGVTASSSDSSIVGASAIFTNPPGDADGADEWWLILDAVASGTATVTVTADDGLESASTTLSVTVNSPPRFSDVIDGLEITLSPGESQSLRTGVADDDSGDTVTVEGVSSNTRIVTVDISSDGSEVDVRAEDAGSATITLTASDGLESATVAFDVVVNSEPEVVSGADESLKLASDGSHTYDVSDIFEDPDRGDDLEVTASSADREVVGVAVSSDHTSITISAVGSGTADVMLTATDGHASVDHTIAVSVNARPGINPSAPTEVKLRSPTANDGTSHAIEFDKIFVDPDEDDTLTVTATSEDTNIATVSVRSEDIMIAVASSSGATKVAVTGTDSFDESASHVIAVSVNWKPEIVEGSELADVQLKSDGSSEVNVGSHFRDRDNERLEYTVVSDNPAVATARVNGGIGIDGSSVIIVTAVGAGEATITVTATDSMKEYVSDTMQVFVNQKPVIGAIEPMQINQDASGAVDIAAHTSDDEDVATLTYGCASGDALVATATIAGSVCTVAGVGSGTTQIAVTATDAMNEMGEGGFDVTVNGYPSASSEIPSITLQVGGESKDVVINVFTDDGGADALTYEVAADPENVASISASGVTATVAPGAAGTAVVTVTATDVGGLSATTTFNVAVSDSKIKAVANEVLASVGRNILQSVSDSVGGRLNQSSNDGMSLTSMLSSADFLRQFVTSSAEGGYRHGGGYGDDDRSGYGGGRALFSSLGGAFGSSHALGGSDFLVRMNGDSKLSIWGAADQQSFEGADYDGAATSLYLGVDMAFGNNLVGVAAARNSSESDYEYGTASQTLETSLTTFIPYGRMSPTETSTVWGLFGTGSGEAETTLAGTTSTATGDLSLTLFMVGGRYELLPLGDMSLALVGDFGAANLETESDSGSVDGLEASVNRFRAAIEGSWSNEMDEGASFTPFGQLGVRQDGGDGESTGTGLEVAGGVRVCSGTMSLEAKARFMAVHTSEDYSDSGFSVVASVSPAADGAGFSLTLQPAWGDTSFSQSSDDLWQGQTLGSSVDEFVGEYRSFSVDAQMGYGFKVVNDRYMLTPFLDLGSAGASYQETLLGARLHQVNNSPFEMEFSAGRVDHGLSESDVQVSVRGTMRF